MSLRRFYLGRNIYLKLIEFPALYNTKTDELYCIDQQALDFFLAIDRGENVDTERWSKEEIEILLKEGILREEPTDRLRPPVRQSPVPSLRYLELQITRRCNLRCRHCFVGEASNVDLGIEEIKKVLREFEELQGLRVLITGGEPLMHPDFLKINQYLETVAVRKILFTNGLLLNDKVLSVLKFDEIQISIDGMKRGHEILRGKNTFDRALSALKRALDRGFDVSVATVIHRENLNEFEELEATLREYRIREWIVDAMAIAGNLRNNRELAVTPEQASEIMKRYGFTKEDHPKAEGYGCGAHLLSVLATGEVAFCSYYGDSPIGHLRDGLESLWLRKKHVKIEELECYGLECRFIDECRGGCRFRAESITGSNKAPDKLRCRFFGINHS